ncbi:MAG: SMI1/KNR4 family protein [Candidatus Melainabacteria bacterium]|nr:SMI1/KNR4 family protein [Candidatus Melainabacteria bacterium]
MIEILSPGPSIKLEQIDNIEKTLKVSFPEDYKRFLLAHNGGTPSPGAFNCVDGESSSVCGFHEIGADDHKDILNVAKIRKDRLPRNFVAIACDGGGNEICIDCEPGQDFGKVYFWEHETEADLSQGETPETAGNIHLIAPSFTKFLECLHEAPMTEISPELKGELSTPPENEGVYEAMLKRKGLMRE